MVKRKNVILFANSAFMIVNFRKDLIIELDKRGYRVLCFTTSRASQDHFGQLPICLINLRELFVFLKNEENIILSYTAIANFFSAVLAKFFDVTTIPNITGLGSLYEKRSTRWFYILLTRFFLARSATIFVQNSHDEKVIRSRLPRLRIVKLPGSGINVHEWRFLPGNKRKKIIFMARLTVSKGVWDFVRLFCDLKDDQIDVEAFCCGSKIGFSKGGVSSEEILQRVENDSFKLMGHVDSSKLFSNGGVLIFPSSYFEGTPRAVLEAMASGVRVLAYDNPGLRDLQKALGADTKILFENYEDMKRGYMNMLQETDIEYLRILVKCREVIEKYYKSEIVTEEYLKTINMVESK